MNHLVKYSFGVLALCTLLASGCQPKQETAAQESEASVVVANFVPNPVKVPKTDVKTLKIGDVAPDFELPDMNGNMVSLSDFKEAEVLTVIFTCNHCPTAQAYEDRIIAYTNDYKDKNVQVVAITPNSSLGLLLEECAWSDLNDSFEEMKIRAKHKGFNFPYLYDGDNHAVSIKYGPTTTPHTFIFDKARKLRYVGRIDDKERPEKGGKGEDIRAATDAILAGQEVAVNTTKSFGCSVKWAWKLDWAEKVNKDWESKPVTLEEVDGPGITQLVKNETDNLRLINVWATWCAPCVMEYPDLVKLQRMYGKRGFEFVSLSADVLDKKDKALSFLQESNSAVANYISSEEDKYKLIEYVDAEWNGALPYSMLIEPGGKVVWRHQGVVDMLELKRTIVEHENLGRYF